MNSISSLPLPRHPTSDSDPESDGEDSTLGLVLDRSAASSTVSMEPHDRVDALQRANAELGRKLMEAERTLQGKLNDHENELEEMQGRLEEVRSELSATKREEKELRAKEVSRRHFVLISCSDVYAASKLHANKRTGVRDCETTEKLR
jgi:TolA-binding protein